MVDYEEYKMWLCHHVWRRYINLNYDIPSWFEEEILIGLCVAIKKDVVMIVGFDKRWWYFMIILSWIYAMPWWCGVEFLIYDWWNETYEKGM